MKPETRQLIAGLKKLHSLAGTTKADRAGFAQVTRQNRQLVKENAMWYGKAG